MKRSQIIPHVDGSPDWVAIHKLDRDPATLFDRIAHICNRGEAVQMFWQDKDHGSRAHYWFSPAALPGFFDPEDNAPADRDDDYPW